MKLIKKDKKGFTLVELIVVIAILAILALILIPGITGYVSKANKSKNEANARALYSQANFELYTWDASEEEVDNDGGIVTAKKLADKLAKDAAPGTVVVVLNTGEETIKSVTYIPEGVTKPEDAAVWPKGETKEMTQPEK